MDRNAPGDAVQELGRVLVVAGIIAVLVGGVLMLAPRIPWIGRLPGDIVIQRGTMHLWRNPSTTTVCRIVFVLTEAKAYEHEGKPLPEKHP